MAQPTALSRFDEATLNRVLTRYSGDGTNSRLLMHFWSTNRPETMSGTLAERVLRCGTERGRAR